MKEYKVKKKLVQPLLNAKMKPGDAIAVKATGKIYQGKPQKDDKGNDQKPADLMPCYDMEGEKEGEIIVPAVIKSALDDIYPKGEYVGKAFLITKGDKPEGKRYYQYELAELEL